MGSSKDGHGKSPMTPAAASRNQAPNAKLGGGKIPSGNIAARAQRSVARNFGGGGKSRGGK